MGLGKIFMTILVLLGNSTKCGFSGMDIMDPFSENSYSEITIIHQSNIDVEWGS